MAEPHHEKLTFDEIIEILEEMAEQFTVDTAFEDSYKELYLNGPYNETYEE
jgi:hypothetical protein